MSLITLNNIKKIYSGNGVQVEALKGIDLNLQKGEMLAIMGASASGKTTLLNILGLLDKSTEGSYFFGDERIEKFNDKELAAIRNERIGFIVQDFALIERYTVLRNVMLPLYYSKIKRSRWREKAENILRELDVPWQGKIYPSLLSGGQRQRVAIARALVNDADLILADEPTGALDSKTAEEVMGVFKKLNDKGKSVIIVTHDNKIADMCHRTVKIFDGKY